MEAYKGYIKTMKVPVPPTASLVLVQIKDAEGTDIGSAFNATTPYPYTSGLINIDLPYEATSKERRVYVHVKFEVDYKTYENVQILDVVTPLLEKWEIEAILNNPTLDPWTIEAAVRHVINAHCGQEFGLFEGTQIILGNNESALPLNRRAVSVDSLSLRSPQGDLTYNYVLPTGDGWFLKRSTNGVYDSGVYTSNAPITPPSYSRSNFRNDMMFVVKGKFGYEQVPEGVREAAKLLINDYACMDSAYRDRYLKSITAADWRLEFDSGAYARTGNVRADQLLEPYVRTGIGVV